MVNKGHPFKVDGDVIFTAPARVTAVSSRVSGIEKPFNAQAYDSYIHSLRIDDAVIILYPNGYQQKARVEKFCYQTDDTGISKIRSLLCLTAHGQTIRVSALEHENYVPKIKFKNT